MSSICKQLSMAVKPQAVSGWLAKQTTGVRNRWTCRHFRLEEGQLSWSLTEHAPHAAQAHEGTPACPAKISCIDLAQTPCEVALHGGEAAGCLVLRPEKGHRWPRAARHSRAGTSRPLLLMLSDRQDDRSLREWAVAIEEHRAYGLKLLQGAKCRCGACPLRHCHVIEEASARGCCGAQESEEDEECPICLESLSAPALGPVCQTPCGHAFHAACLHHFAHHWATRTPSCPLCKAKL